MRFNKSPLRWLKYLAIIVSLTTMACDAKDEENEEEEDAASTSASAPFDLVTKGSCDSVYTGSVTLSISGDVTQTASYDCLITPAVSIDDILYFQFYDRFSASTAYQNNHTFTVTVHTITSTGTFAQANPLVEGKSYVGFSFRENPGDTTYATDGLWGPSRCGDSCGAVTITTFDASPAGTVAGTIDDAKVARVDEAGDVVEEVVVNGEFEVTLP